MQALCLQDKSIKYIDNFPQIQTQDDEALVAVRLAGICGTDLEINISCGICDSCIILSLKLVNEIKLVGSCCGSFKPALQLLEKNLVDPTILIEFSYPLSRGIEAFDFARQSGIFKVLLHNT
jgi:threonine dehydrogenase-like Zn-dependent dehydrogenase